MIVMNENSFKLYQEYCRIVPIATDCNLNNYIIMNINVIQIMSTHVITLKILLPPPKKEAIK